MIRIKVILITLRSVNVAHNNAKIKLFKILLKKFISLLSFVIDFIADSKKGTALP